MLTARIGGFWLQPGEPLLMLLQSPGRGRWQLLGVGSGGGGQDVLKVSGGCEVRQAMGSQWRLSGCPVFLPEAKTHGRLSRGPLNLWGCSLGGLPGAEQSQWPWQRARPDRTLEPPSGHCPVPCTAQATPSPGDSLM